MFTIRDTGFFCTCIAQSLFGDVCFEGTSSVCLCPGGEEGSEVVTTASLAVLVMAESTREGTTMIGDRVDMEEDTTGGETERPEVNWKLN